eukprot:COSAG01_NODE_5418_length_4274_cov_12.202150_10_plen_21_part_01
MGADHSSVCPGECVAHSEGSA